MPDFDPYHRWLGITPDEQPPTPHRLLGIAPDETDKETIRRAALQRNAFIRDFSLGEQGKIAERLLNEIAAARDVILAGIMQPAVETPSPVETPFEPDEENTDPAVAPTAQAPNSISQTPVIPAIHIAVEKAHSQLDAYYEWLGILPDEQPASHYRLLAIQEFESNASIINDAAERRFILLRQFQPGPDAEMAEDLLNEVARARNCLLDVHSKAKYDQQLKDIRQPDQLAATEVVPDQNPTPLVRPLQQKLVEARNVEPTSIPKKQFIKLGFAAGIVVVLITGMIIKSNFSTKALETAIAKGDWQAALEIDPNSSDGLRLKAEALNDALAKGHWQTVLRLDPKNSKILELRAAAVPATPIKAREGHRSQVKSVAFSLDGRTIASGSADQTVKLWDSLSGAELKTLTGHRRQINSVAFSPDGKTIASASSDDTIKLWDVDTGKELNTLTGHTIYVKSVAFSPDGKTIASGGYDKTVKLWDVDTGEELKTLRGHDGSILSVAFSPDGRTIASGSGDQTVKLWDSQSGAEIKTLTAATYVISVAFSPDGKTIASGGGNGFRSGEFYPIQLWNVGTGAELNTLDGHDEYITSVAFSPDGKTIASASKLDIKLWDIQTGAEIKTLKNINREQNLAVNREIFRNGKPFVGFDRLVNSVAFSPDGKTLASGDNGGAIKLWDVSALAEPSP